MSRDGGIAAARKTIRGDVCQARSDDGTVSAQYPTVDRHLADHFSKAEGQQG